MKTIVFKSSLLEVNMASIAKLFKKRFFLIKRYKRLFIVWTKFWSGFNDVVIVGVVVYVY